MSFFAFEAFCCGWTAIGGHLETLSAHWVFDNNMRRREYMLYFVNYI
ncbi:hypothetical protein AtEden1_Chr5g0130661 [Arabidopsis thaliana]